MKLNNAMFISFEFSMIDIHSYLVLDHYSNSLLSCHLHIHRENVKSISDLI